jgi:hypothetical protein
MGDLGSIVEATVIGNINDKKSGKTGEHEEKRDEHKGKVGK